MTSKTLMDEKRSIHSLDRSAMLGQDSKKIERISEEVQELVHRQQSIDRHMSSFEAAVDKIEARAAADLRQAKQDLCSFVNQSLSKVEDRITELVQATLTDHRSSFFIQLTRTKRLLRSSENLF